MIINENVVIKRSHAATWASICLCEKYYDEYKELFNKFLLDNNIDITVKKKKKKKRQSITKGLIPNE
jgi:maltose-binding protein MalE